MATLKQRDASFDDLRPLLDIGGAIVSRLERDADPDDRGGERRPRARGSTWPWPAILRIASDEATFSESFVKIGLCPDWGGTFALTLSSGSRRRSSCAGRAMRSTLPKRCGSGS